jgi:hypothetical protein
MYLWADPTTSIYIPEVVTTKIVGNEVHIIGTARKKGNPYFWEAWPLPHGYYVIVRNNSGREESLQGSTFNLVLEVAAAVNRTL